MHKKLISFYLTSLFLGTLFLSVSCQVGLGSAVDTEAPTLEITYPPASAVIKGTFTLAGTCSDDKGIGTISVTVTNTDDKSRIWTAQAALDASGKSWSVDLNRTDSSSATGFQYPDGKYEIAVTAKDNAGHTSGVSSRSLEIDNTAPVFIVKTPAAVVQSKASKYGSLLSIAGTIADDHTIKTMAVSIYDKNGTLINSEPYTETNVETAGGTSVSVAKYAAGGSDDLNARYTAIYGSNAKAGTQYYYSTVTLTDAAKTYTNPAETSNTTTGNTTSSCWLYDDVYTTLMSTKNGGYGLEASDLKNILNGNLTGTITRAQAVDASTVRSSLNTLVKNTAVTATRLAFSLNPDASPRYVVNGYALPSDLSNIESGTRGQTITVVATSGLDGTLIVPSTLKVWMHEYDSLSDSSVYSAFINNPGTTTGGVLLKDNSSDGSSSTATCTLSVQLPNNTSILTGKYYIIAVTGTDADSSALTADTMYGFVGAVSGTPPTLSIDSPAELSSTASSDDLEFSLTAKSTTSTIAGVSCTVTVTDETNSSTVGTITGTAVRGSGNTWTFSPKDGSGYSTCKAAAGSGKRYLYTASFKASDQNGNSMTSGRSVHIDSLAPVVKITSVTPTANDSGTVCVNGTITVSGTVNEADLSNVTYAVYVNNSATASATGSLGTVYSFSKEIDTTVFTDTKDIKVVVSAVDNSGNTGSADTTSYNSGTPLVIRQATDAPVLTPNGFDTTLTTQSAIISAQKNIFNTSGNNTLLGTITDDDGIGSVSISIDGGTAVVKNAGNSKTYALSYTLPSAEGIHTVAIHILDTPQDPTGYNGTSYSFAVAVDKGAPQFAVTTTSGSYYAPTTPIAVAGTVSDAGTPVTVKVFTSQADATANGTSVRTVSVSGTSWSDTIPTGAINTDGATVYYTATDCYGQTAQAQFVYKVDVTPPSITSAAFASTHVYLDESSYSGFSVTASDPGASATGIAGVYYQLSDTQPSFTDDTGWTALGYAGGTSYTGNINFSGKTDGTQKIWAAAKDNAGNRTVYGYPASITVDRQKPSVSVTNGSPTTDAQSDSVLTIRVTDTNPSVPSVTVTAPNGSAVSVAISPVSTTVQSGYTEWTAAVPFKTSAAAFAADGSYTVLINETDQNGRTADAVTYSILKDTTPPVVTITAPSANAVTNGTTGTFTGTVTDLNISTVIVNLYEDGSNISTVDITNVVKSDGSWEWKKYELEDGHAYNITVTAQDKSGNTTVGTSSSITIDTTAPDSTLAVNPSDALYTTSGSAAGTPSFGSSYLVKTGFTFSGVLTEKNINSRTLTVSRDGGAASALTFTSYTAPTQSASGSWSYVQAAGTDGTYTYTLTITDRAGNQFSKSVTVTIDTTAPSLEVTSPANNESVETNTKTIKGTAADSGAGIASVYYELRKASDDTVVRDASSNQIQGSATLTGESWNTDISLGTNEGSLKLYVKATDKLGHVTEETQPFYYDKANPVLSETGIDVSGRTTASTFTLSGTASDTNALAPANPVTIVDTLGGTTVGTYYPTVSGNTWSLPLTPTGSSGAVTDGTHVYTITARDVAGKTTALTRTVIADKTKPVWNTDSTSGKEPYITTSKTNNYYKSTSISIKALAVDVTSGVSKLQYNLNDQTDANYTDTGNGSFTITAAEGNNTIYVRALDAAGNKTDPTALVASIDTTAPDTCTLDTVDGVTGVSTKLTNGSSGITFTFAAADGSGTNPSGIASAALIKIGSTSVTPSAGNGTLTTTGTGGIYSLTIPSSLITTSGTVTVRLTDNAGNTANFALFMIELDNVAPVFKISSPAASTTVNKTISLNGTASDNKELASAALSVSTDNTTFTTIATYVSSAGSNTLVVNSDNTWTISSFDTTAYHALSGTLYFKLSGTDSAGNQGSTTNSVTVDQNADRPVVTLTNLKTSGSTLTSGTLYGTVSDDDGTPAAGNFYVSEDNSTWYTSTSVSSPVTYSGGAWSYALSTAVQGTRTLYFKIIDNTGTSFASNDPSDLGKPYVRGTAYAAPATDQSTYVTYTLDTNPPAVTSVKITMSGGTAEDLVNNIKFGKNNPTFTLSVTASDTSGIKSISAQFGTLAAVTNTVNSTGSTPVTATLSMTAPTTDNLCETQDIVITATDENNSQTLFTRTVIVDNAAPSLTIVSPAAGTQITGDIEVRGTASDGTNGTGVGSVKWYIPDNATAGSWSTMSAAAKDAYFTNTLSGTASWSISFTEGNAGKLSQFFYSETAGDGTVTWYNKPSAGSSLTYGMVVSTGVWKLPVYFRTEDQTGNVTYSTDYYLNINPDGDRPTSTITYPETNAILGGTIRTFGTAYDNESVASVHMEIQKATYNASGALTSSYASINSSYDNITVSGTTSWNYSIDGTSSTFAPPGTYKGDGTDTYASTADYYNKSTIRIRTWAVDNNGTAGGYTDWVVIAIDKNAPKIGSTNPMKLVRYESDGTTIKASQTYTSGMYISGEWYLICSVEDENGIQTIETQSETVTKTSSDASVDTTLTKGTQGAITAGTSGYNIKIKLATQGTGTIKFNIYALDNSTPNQYSSQAVYVKFDNTAPAQTDLYHNGTKVGPGTDSTTSAVIQENYTYLVNSTVTETGSGLERTAVYLKRTNKDDSSADVRIYDPRLEQTSGSDTAYNRLAVDGTTVKADSVCDYLPYKEYTGITRTAGSFTLGVQDKFIRKGSLVRIAGVYRLIDSVSADKLTMTFSPEDTTLSTTVDAVYALVVDNTKYETLTNGVVGGDGDDGDGIYDYVSDDGSSYSWKMAFDSQNVPDGPLTICYVSFDAAGNASGLKTVTTNVKNNNPRLAKILLGTDLNGNSKYDFYGDTSIVNDTSNSNTSDGKSFGEFNYYSTLDRNTGKGKTSATLSSSSFIVKNGMCVLPEFTGGNGSIEYTLTAGNSEGTYKKATDSGLVQVGGVSLISLTTKSTLTSSYVADKTGTTLNSADQISSFGGVVLQNTTLQAYESKTSSTTSVKYFTFTFWDSTEETVQGTSSQYALLNVPVIVDVTDDVKPNPVVNPFYWNSITSNSLYDSASASTYADLKGHIELGATPSVSGIISIKGTAYDETRLSTLVLSITDIKLGTTAYGANATLAKYDTSTGKWKYSADGGTTFGAAGTDCTATVAANGWHFTVTDPNGPTQSGHTVTWQLDLDTSRLNGVAGSGKAITVTANDGTNDSDSSTTQTGTTVYATDSQSAAGHYYSTAALAAAGGTADITLPVTAAVNKGTTAASSVYTYTYGTTPYYSVDVVPYITKLATSLDKAYSSNTSVFNRSAQGAYPVRRGETITIYGFNLNGTSTSATLNGTSGVLTIGASSLTDSKNGASSVKATLGTGTTTVSGPLVVTVSGVTSINNSNDDTAAYNQEPNSVNNNSLTDTRKLYVYKMSTVATDSTIRYPTMRVGKDSGQTVAFTYDVGGDKVYMYKNGSASNVGTSFTQWYDTSVAVDNNGNVYGSSMNGDCASSGSTSFSSYANYTFYPWITSSTSSTWAYSSSSTAKNWENCYNGTVYTSNRIKNPKMTATYAGSTGYVYTTYYDSSLDIVKFRYGTVTSGPTVSSALGNYSDSKGSTTGYQVIAGTGATGTYALSGSSTDNTGRAGEYSAVGVIPSGVTGAGTAVVAWYDSSSQSLMYSYNTAPTSTANASQWGTNTKRIDADFAGWYVDMAVDAGGGVHIAYYSAGSGDLRYAYLPTYSSTPQVCTVDSYLSTGTNISIETKATVVNSTTYYVPYISYYMSAFTKTGFSVRTAWLTTLGASSVPDGTSNDLYTGTWEAMTVPTDQIPLDYSVGIGLKTNDSSASSILLGYGTTTGLQTALLQ